ncbi:MAG: adenine phosphoribosyltransferase, partial [Nevskia sp.]|nr:adenine phosphoribosyltransferase [Nevskia sp.]
DLLATGGTMAATIKLLRMLQVEVAGAAFVVELGFLQGRKQLPDVPIETIVTY